MEPRIIGKRYSDTAGHIDCPLELHPVTAASLEQGSSGQGVVLRSGMASFHLAGDSRTLRRVAAALSDIADSMEAGTAGKAVQAGAELPQADSPIEELRAVVRWCDWQHECWWHPEQGPAPTIAQIIHLYHLCQAWDVDTPECMDLDLWSAKERGKAKAALQGWLDDRG
tara:strand:- start:2454 stop:2960 length:507 start_codon:yes stop_codon:yes gene_type:complete